MVEVVELRGAQRREAWPKPLSLFPPPVVEL